MINITKKSINTIAALVLVAGTQAQSQQTAIVATQTQQKMHTILLPKIAPECPKQTKLIIPEWSNWAEILKVFQTCSESLDIKVLGNNQLEVHDGTNTWTWIYNPDRTSIVPNNLSTKISKK